MPLRDLLCKDCGHQFEELVYPDDRPTCVQCDSFRIEVLPALIGGYAGDMGGASTRPRSSGSFKKAKK